jgi:hypothetical protein
MSANATESQVRTLEFPHWVPPCLITEARAIYDGANDEFKERLIIRLTSNSRMEKVWCELYKRNSRANTQYRYHARHKTQTSGQKTQPDSSPVQQQDEAVRCFFLCAYDYAACLDFESVLSDSQVEERRAPYSKAAEQLLKLAETVKGFNMNTEAEELEKIAEKVKDHWPDDPYLDIWVTRNERTQGIETRTDYMGHLLNIQNLRRYVAQLADASKKLFGTVLNSNVATVANVAFELEGPKQITGEQVRQILRSAPTLLPGLWDFSRV